MKTSANSQGTAPRARNVPAIPADVAQMLLPGEQVLGCWRPVFWRFIEQFVLAGLLTSLVLVFFNLALSLWQWLVILLVSVAVWGFVFDDWRTWLARRGDVWVLTDRRLIFFNRGETAQPAAVALDQIRGLSRWPWLSLRVRLETGAQVVLKFLPAPRRARAAILAQKAR